MTKRIQRYELSCALYLKYIETQNKTDSRYSQLAFELNNLLFQIESNFNCYNEGGISLNDFYKLIDIFNIKKGFKFLEKLYIYPKHVTNDDEPFEIQDYERFGYITMQLYSKMISYVNHERLNDEYNTIVGVDKNVSFSIDDDKFIKKENKQTFVLVDFNNDDLIENKNSLPYKIAKKHGLDILFLFLNDDYLSNEQHSLADDDLLELIELNYKI